ncbi:MAG: hypothetical protein ABSB50_11630 [Terracidiphilus sp.]|jgi:hypothetical protein
MIPDTWIEIHGPCIAVSRIQILNNWSPGLIAGPGRAWLGLDYLCYEIDSLWALPDAEMARLAIGEASGIGVFESG